MNSSSANCSSNQQTIWPSSCYSISGALLVTTIISMIILTIATGNILVIIAVFKDRKLRKMRQNWLIVSLAISDLLVGILIMPLTLTYEILNEWVLGVVLCEIWAALDVLFVTASILNLCIISLDRYWAVTDIHYAHSRTPFRIAALITLAWLIAIAISIPPVFGWHPHRNPGECHVSSDLGYVLYSALGSFYIPVMLILAVYARIFHITKRRSQSRLREASATEKAVNVQQPQGKCSSTIYIPPGDQKENHLRCISTPLASSPSSTAIETTNIHSVATGLNNNSSIRRSPQRPPRLPLKYSNGTSSLPTQKRSLVQVFLHKQRQSSLKSRETPSSPQSQLKNRRMKLKQRERRSTFVLGVILLSFVACWLPFFICYLLGTVNYQVSELLFDIFFWMGYCNSAFNPVIYTVFNMDFRNAFYKIITRQ